ncbi:hypothetical protein BDZ89DRAFT_1193040 [Hymenopellis radicata]|nr:hypothetical protein BDZ89DRAFT_1193040 [Hymenopellis radicata]
MARDADALYDLLGIDSDGFEVSSTFIPSPPIILVTHHRACIICPPGTRLTSLRQRTKVHTVWILDKDRRWRAGNLLVGRCGVCKSDYYPDCIVSPGDIRHHRIQRLDYDARYLRISKRGIWVHRYLAIEQEKAVARFKCGWANFAEWMNDSLRQRGESRKITTRQSKRLFVEHLSRRLLVAHAKPDVVQFPSNATTDVLMKSVRDVLGINGGLFPSAMDHGCKDCTHKKRYKEDLIAEGAILGTTVDGLDDEDLISAYERQLNQATPAPAPDEPRGYVRLAVMDGKNTGHRICAVRDCKSPLKNFKNGRFCSTHLDEGLADVCGLVGCNQPVEDGSLTCSTPTHKSWYKHYSKRFKRLGFDGVRRVIRRQQEFNAPAADPTRTGHAPPATFNIDLPSLDDLPGTQVEHTFRACNVYCIQTVQWACGFPIGWGKCYSSESPSQVLRIIDDVWVDHHHLKPSILAYDNACKLLRHIITQDRHSHWLQTTKFIVDVWHYIGHKASDSLCRLWCNPTPKNGSQPDLICTATDSLGNTFLTRAFNTETAEQLNSWLDGFDTQLRQMTDITFDFYLHSLFLMYADMVQGRIDTKDRGLDEDFWVEILG